MTYAMVDTYCASYKRPPRAVTLDIDDTLVHGYRQLSLFNTTLRMRLIKIAARIVETASRVRIAFAQRTPRRRCLQASRAISSRPDRKNRGICPATSRSRQPTAPARYVRKSR